LIEKNRPPASALDDLGRAIGNPNHIFQEAPLTMEVVYTMHRAPRNYVPDMPDRIVAATAIFLDVPLISCDKQIRASPVQTIW
jgi:PIN domain nuclease of toxin-antitoxin system